MANRTHSKKAWVGFIVVFIFCAVCVGIALYTLFGPETVLNSEQLLEPDSFYYKEFTVDSAGALQIDVSCSNENGLVCWYLLRCDKETYFANSRGVGFMDLTYASHMNSARVVSDRVDVEAGTYTFVYIQTVGWLQEQWVSAKITYSSS